MPLHTYLVFLVIMWLHCDGIVLNWTLSTSSLPGKVKAQIGGYCNITNKVWLFGGAGQETVVWSYDVITESVNTYSSSSIQFPTYLGTVPLKNGVMYWNSPPSSSSISRFFTQSASFDYNYLQHPQSYQDFRIVISMNNDPNILFLLGGSGTNEFHLFDLNNTLNWYIGMNYSVDGLGRQPSITSNYLYRILGTGIEYIDITGTINDIISRNWVFVAKNLQNRYTAGPIVQNTYSNNNELWLIGGYINYALMGVKIINIDSEEFNITTADTPTTMTDTVSVYVDYLDTIYVLGGLCDECGWETDYIYKVKYWQQTNEPTYSPTIYPSIQPTNNPTIIPTIYPSTQPTNNPTIIPTFIPTIYPSTQPTNNPTIIPSFQPINNPTEEATYAPTKSPLLDHEIQTTITTSIYVSEASSNNEENNNTIVIIIVISLVVLLLIAIFLIYYCYKKRSENINQKLSKVCSTEMINSDVDQQMNENVGTAGNITIDQQFVTKNNIKDDTDIISSVDETFGNEKAPNYNIKEGIDDDQDLIDNVNETFGNDKIMHDDTDIVQSINKTPIEEEMTIGNQDFIIDENTPGNGETTTTMR